MWKRRLAKAISQITAIPVAKDDRWSLLIGLAVGEVAITHKNSGERIAEDTGVCLVLSLQSHHLRPASRVIPQTDERGLE